MLLEKPKKVDEIKPSSPARGDHPSTHQYSGYSDGGKTRNTTTRDAIGKSTLWQREDLQRRLTPDYELNPALRLRGGMQSAESSASNEVEAPGRQADAGDLSQSIKTNIDNYLGLPASAQIERTRAYTALTREIGNSSVVAASCKNYIINKTARDYPTINAQTFPKRKTRFLELLRQVYPD